jgi:hypothetical protein
MNWICNHMFCFPFVFDDAVTIGLKGNGRTAPLTNLGDDTRRRII